MALRTPAFNDAKTYGFEWLRLVNETALQEGVLYAGDFKVTAAAAGAPLRVDVAEGIALVKGDTGTPGTGLTHGLYIAVNDAAIANAVSLTAAHGTLPRIDQIVLRIRDTADLGSSADSAALEVVTGTATSGATLDNRTGAGALPADAIRLADVLVPAAATAVIAGNVRDRRPWTRGAYRRIIRNANAGGGSDYTTTATSPGLVDATNLQPRLEVAGNPVRMSFRCRARGSLANVALVLLPFIDGSNANADLAQLVAYVVAATQDPAFAALDWDTVPAAGSHLFGWGYSVGATSTFTILATAAFTVQTVVQEIVTQNADNT